MLPLMQSTKLFLGKSFSIVLHWHTNRYYNRWWCMEMVHLKRGCGNFPTYSEMNYWRRCICMRCWWYIWIEKRRDPDEILFAIFDLVRKIEEEWEFVWIWIELKKKCFCRFWSTRVGRLCKACLDVKAFCDGMLIWTCFRSFWHGNANLLTLWMFHLKGSETSTSRNNTDRSGSFLCFAL